MDRSPDGACTGVMSLRFDGATLVAEAASGRVALEYGFLMGRGPGAHLRAVPGVPAEAEVRSLGPGGVEASFDWRAAYDETADTMLRARLLNDVASYT
jgi:hypothetical protein